MSKNRNRAESAGDDESAMKRKRFVHAAYEMVSCKTNHNAIRFTDDGLRVEIRNVSLLAETVLPNFFKHKNVSSFIRQLNNYGFKTTPSAENVAHTFYHEHFRRDGKDLLNSIVRKTSSPNSSRSSNSRRLVNEDKGMILERVERLRRQKELAHRLELQNKKLSEENKRMRVDKDGMQSIFHHAQTVAFGGSLPFFQYESDETSSTTTNSVATTSSSSSSSSAMMESHSSNHNNNNATNVDGLETVHESFPTLALTPPIFFLKDEDLDAVACL